MHRHSTMETPASVFQQETKRLFEDWLHSGAMLAQTHHQQGQAYLIQMVNKSSHYDQLVTDVCASIPLDAQITQDPDFVTFKNSLYCQSIVNEVFQSFHDPLAYDGYSFYLYKKFLHCFQMYDRTSPVRFSNTALAQNLARLLEATRTTYATQLLYTHPWMSSVSFNEFQEPGHVPGFSSAAAIQTFSGLWQRVISHFSFADQDSPRPNP